MSHTRTYGSYRTGGLWVAAGVSFGVVAVGSVVALFGMLEYDERCMHGLIRGPGRLRRTRDQAFPPATICEFQYGEVSSTGQAVSVLLWAGLTVMVICLFTALLAECFEPRLGTGLVEPVSRAEKLRRTGTAFFVTGSVFLMFYALAGWRLHGTVVGLLVRRGLVLPPAEDAGVQLLPAPGDLPVRQWHDAADESRLDGVPGNGVGGSRAAGRSRLRPCLAALERGTAYGAAGCRPGRLRHR